MFRRPGKNPLEDYKDEMNAYKYGASKTEETTSRIFDSVPHVQPMATPMSEDKRLQEWGTEGSTLPHHLKGMIKEEVPETTLGEGVTFRGELSFERLLRIDGTFEGNLLSQGKVVVGPKGKVKANLNLREAIIEGQVEGNITVQEKLELRGQASIKGDIKAKRLSVDDGVELFGVVQVGAMDSSY
ncbi:MAG: polymer-forming cytoskeletal protein [Verrucomicrobia bacterium]|nr:polymer-forming cytoskeletal protein [Verrucomicrobiota bacterium]MBS0646638.1 polymer-forming cytoskeletal protein [Verrucomicrobiota bacterium]